MAEVIDALSKFHQSEEALRAMTEKAVGKFSAFSAKELGGGLCNAVYLIEADGVKYVLKIAPEDSVVMMRHEKDIVETEAEMLRVFVEKLNIPAPRLVFADNSRTVCDVPYFFMSFTEGQPLNSLEERPTDAEITAIKRRVGEICRDICSVKAEKFGIPALKETWFDNNCDFVMKLFEMLLADAADKDVKIPGMKPAELMKLLGSLRPVLNEASEPCCAHTDTWDGNLMIKDGKLVSLIDYAAVLYADPLISHDFHDFGPTPCGPFLDGFGKTSFTKAELLRIQVYKIWQRLGMIVERGYRGYNNPDMYAWVIGEYEKELQKLIVMLPVDKKTSS